MSPRRPQPLAHAARRAVATALVAAGAVVGTAEAEERALAIRAAKILTCAVEGEQVLDHAWMLVRDGVVEGFLDARAEEPGDDYERVDLGDRWLMPGMVDLHSHVGGSFDINGAVYQANTGLRVTTSVVPGNRTMRVGLASGVTTVLFIPGSATTVGGQGVLIKTGFDRWDRTVVRDPGSLKVAQADNPKRWGYRMNRIMLNWQIRDVMRRGVAYAERWAAFERGEGEEPRIDIQFEIFRPLVAREAQISTHTQVGQVVAASVRIMVAEFGLPMFIDHGTMDGYRVAEYVIEHDVPAILGPRNFSSETKGRGIDHDGRIEGVAANYQSRGHRQIGFNTDAPVIPQEELSLQAGIAVRFGFEDDVMQTVRGLTIVPAVTAGIDHRVGSLEPGKDADVVAISGHPGDPRTRVDLVWLEGELVYDAEVERLF